MDRNLVSLYILIANERLWKSLGPHFLSGLALIKSLIFIRNPNILIYILICMKEVKNVENLKFFIA